MTPVRRARIGPALGPTGAPHTRQRALDEGARRRHADAGAPDLGHGRGDEVALQELDRDAAGREFGA